MLFACSGSQGSGKSTVLSALSEKGYEVVERKTSRSILQDWNVTLEEVNTNPELTLKFQDEILERKVKDEAAHIDSNNHIFTERTYADLFTYALVSLGNNNQYSDWLDRYYTKCQHYSKLYSHVFFIRGGLFDLEHDGVRGSNMHYSRMVDITMLDITKRLVDNDKLTLIDVVDIDERLSIILDSSEGS